MSLNDELYETSDLAFASFLAASGHSILVDIKSNGSLKKSFMFKPKPDQKVLLGFYSGAEKVSAIKLIEAYQRLKAATYTLKWKE